MTIKPFDTLINDLIPEISSYLDDRSVLVTSRICTTWSNIKELDSIRDQARARLIEAHYPPNLVRVLKESGRPISKLPHRESYRGLYLVPYRGTNPTIDSIQFKYLTDPVMRCVDLRGRWGLVFKIQGKKKDWIQIPEYPRREVQIDKIQSTFVIFQTALPSYLNRNPRWEIWWENSDSTIQKIYSEYHKKRGEHEGGYYNVHDCSTCPFQQGMITDETLGRLLNGTDPLFSLVERNKQAPQEENKEESNTD